MKVLESVGVAIQGKTIVLELRNGGAKNCLERTKCFLKKKKF